MTAIPTDTGCAIARRAVDDVAASLGQAAASVERLRRLADHLDVPSDEIAGLLNALQEIGRPERIETALGPLRNAAAQTTTRRFFLAWHPDSERVALRWKSPIGLAEWRARKWSAFPGTPHIEDLTPCAYGDEAEIDGLEPWRDAVMRIACPRWNVIRFIPEVVTSISRDEVFVIGEPIVPHLLRLRSELLKRIARAAERVRREMQRTEAAMGALDPAGVDAALELGTRHMQARRTLSLLRDEVPPDEYPIPFCLYKQMGWNDAQIEAVRQHYLRVSAQRAREASARTAAVNRAWRIQQLEERIAAVGENVQLGHAQPAQAEVMLRAMRETVARWRTEAVGAES